MPNSLQQAREKYLSEGRSLKVLFWALTRSPPRWPKMSREPLFLEEGPVKLTWLHHATCLIKSSGAAFLTDPIWSWRAGPLSLLGPGRAAKPFVALKELPALSAILISHNHYDHLCRATLKKLPQVPIITGQGNRPYLKGFKDVIELSWWESITVAGHKITYVPAQHYSARSLWDHGRALWGGFMVEGPRTIYFAGDTAFDTVFHDIRMRFPHIDYAFLPVGSYKPIKRLKSFHMNPEEAMRAHEILGVKRSIPIHHSTFQLGDEEWDEPLASLNPDQFVINQNACDPLL